MKNSITQITVKFNKNIGEIFKEAVLLQAQRICLMQRQAGTLRQTIEKYRERIGPYPTRVLADNIYRNRDNLNFCKEHGIRLSGPALGRPKKDELPDLKQNYIDECREQGTVLRNTKQDREPSPVFWSPVFWRTVPCLSAQHF